MSSGNPTVTSIDVERLVEWTYRVQMADRQSGLGLYTASQVEAERRRGWRVGELGRQAFDYASLGLDVDGGRYAELNARLHVDAALVHERVLGLASHAAALLIWHGRTGGRPEVDVPVAVLRPVLREGRPRRAVVEATADGLKYCPLDVDGDAQTWGLSHATYQAWHAGLVGLVASLAASARDGKPLRDHAVTGPRAPPLAVVLALAGYTSP